MTAGDVGEFGCGGGHLVWWLWELWVGVLVGLEEHKGINNLCFDKA